MTTRIVRRRARGAGRLIAPALLAALVAVPVFAHPAGPGEGGAVTPSGRIVTPAGDQVRVGRFPQALALAPDGGHVAVANTGFKSTVSWIDTATLQVQTVAPAEPENVPPTSFDDLGTVFAGLVFSADGRRLWASGGPSGRIFAFDATPVGPVQDTGATIDLPARHVGRLALSPDGGTLYATDSDYRSEAVLAIDLATGRVVRRELPGRRPFALAAAGDRVYVAGMLSGEVIALDQGLSILDSERVGLRPMALASAGGELLVADADADEAIVLEASSLEVRQRIAVGDVLGARPGASPGDVAVSGDVAAVTLGGANGLAILDRRARGKDGKPGQEGGSRRRTAWFLRGVIPTGITPEAVVLARDGGTAWVANARGDGSALPVGAVPDPGPSPVTGRYGTASRIRVEPDLSEETETVRANNVLSGPAGGGFRPPIEHVVFILRENKTFDSLLGDTPGGDPRFVVFPRPNTPTLHDLADRYAVLTDMHANGEASDQGHQWATGGYVTDFVQRFTPASDCMTDVWGCGNDPITYPRSGYLYDALERSGLSWRVYGEWLPLLSRGGPERPELADNRVAGYPGFDLSVPDTERARLWRADFEARGLPRFSFVYLPADHGLTLEDESHPTLQQQVADNHRATGEIIEAISRSPYWPRTAVFITEDDPQGYFDHVDGQRTVGMIVSPWARRGPIGDHTDTVGMVRTMMWLLDLPPLSAYDAGTPPLAQAFTDRPDFAPFAAPPEGFGTPPPPAAAARARSLIEALPRQTGPDQVPPEQQLEITSLATRGLTAAELAASLGVSLEDYVGADED